MAHPDDDRGSDCVVGLLADPEAPTTLANRLAGTLEARLADGPLGRSRVTVEVASEPFTTGTEDASTLLDRIADRADGRSWDVTIGLTELPLRARDRYLVANVDPRSRSALLSLPALGGLRLHSAALGALTDLVAELASNPRAHDQATDPRFVAPGTWGRLRLLGGMVRTNQPWKLVPGLSRAMAAALATGAIATVNSTVWLLSESLSTTRLAVAMVGSLALIVGWLIVDANLWHRPNDESGKNIDKRALYNASTVLTVAGGCLICYSALYVVNLLWALFIVNGQAFQQMVGHPMSGTQQLTLAWLVTSAATVGGALGSGLESDDAVRAAAFGKREQERRRMLEEQQDPQGASS